MINLIVFDQFMCTYKLFVLHHTYKNNMQKNLVLEDRLALHEIQQLEQLSQNVQHFVQRHQGKPIIFLTSGGTSVPLQKNSVRFLQNFATGLRGSLLGEEILSKHFKLIYFYRQNTHIPFSKGAHLNSLLLQEKEEHNISRIKQKLRQYQDSLLLVPFKTVYYYLNGILNIKKILPDQSVIILCAAVSDFIPKNVAQHKIQTNAELNLQFVNSPKLLANMVSPNHLCASFKLETDEQKVKERMEFAINKYGVDMVIGNKLNNKEWVSIFYNRNVFGNMKQQSHQGKVENVIVNRIIQARNIKFGI